MIKSITTKEFNEGFKRPVILKFYGDWCVPCKILKPIMEDLVNKYRFYLDIFDINVDEESELVEKFEIGSVPTLIFIDGDKMEKINPIPMNKKDIIKIIDNFFEKIRG